MNTLFAAALEVQSFCAERRWKLAIIGGLAVQRWGAQATLQRLFDKHHA